MWKSVGPLAASLSLLLAARAEQKPTPRPTSPPPTITPTPLPGALEVQVSVVGADKKKMPGVGSVIWIPGSLDTTPPKAVLPPKITSKNKRFEPRILAVPVGTTVEFPNVDRIHHNVFSLSERAKFDLGLYKNGASKPYRFETPGLVNVYCNIHPQMAAFVFVVDGQIYGQTNANGTAMLAGVPPGKKPLKVWDEKGGEWTGTIDVASGKTTTLGVALDATTFKDAPHKNKYGKDYPPPDDDENRY